VQSGRPAAQAAIFETWRRKWAVAARFWGRLIPRSCAHRRRGGRAPAGELAQPLAQIEGQGVHVGLILAVAAAAAAGAVVVDNSSAFRMDPEIPLVVPEVNSHAIAQYTKRGIIANPNCSTIQMVVALKPIHDRVGIKRLVISTYQAVSGTGAKAIMELRQQVEDYVAGRPMQHAVYPHQIAFNCLPQIDVFLENGYTKEEMKMVNETRKIFEDQTIGVTATTVRVPVFYGHSEAVNIETRKKITAAEVRALLANAPGVELVDEPAKGRYPMVIDCEGRFETMVGRIREDESIANGINLWVVSDNILKGAALNAVQIAEVLIREYL